MTKKLSQSAELLPLRGGFSGRKRIAFSILVSLLSVLCSLIVLEMVVRIKRGKFLSTKNLRGVDPQVLAGPKARPAIYDPLLGFVPNPAMRGVDKASGKIVTIVANGMRSNGVHRSPNGSQILAIGDSFTFGSHVEDDETWPAQLSVLLNRPVWNAGVFGYGIDQMVLRTEKLLGLV